MIFKKKENGSAATKQPLSEHIVFQRISFALNFQIDRIEIASRAKSNMVRRFLRIYVWELESVLSKYAKDDASPKEFLTELYEVAPRVFEEAEKCGIPSLFIDKYKIATKDSMGLIFGGLDIIASSERYHDNRDQICAILDTMIMLLTYIFIESEETLDHLNGELEAMLQGGIFDK